MNRIEWYKDLFLHFTKDDVVDNVEISDGEASIRDDLLSSETTGRTL